MITTRVLVVGSSKFPTGKRKPRIRISGFWLEELGFKPDILVSGEFTQDSITLLVKGFGIDAYNHSIKDIRQKNACLIQVRNEFHNKKRTPHFELIGLWLEKYGFHIGDVVVLHCAYGKITIQRLDIELS